MTVTTIDRYAERMREFNRFYTREIGVLQKGLLESSFSLVEARVLYELAHRADATATALKTDLGLDAGYLSRILQDFKNSRLVASKPSQSDRRERKLELTAKGKRAFKVLDQRSHEQIREMLSRLSDTGQKRLIDAMEAIQQLLDKQPSPQTTSFLLRSHQPGDMGWVVYRHGLLYSQEYGWDEHFEALVAEIVARFIRNFDPAKERCWIAEKNGEILGFVFIVKKSKKIARLRLLLVEPHARGLGIGKRLVKECIRFARQAGYQKITLWTNDVLHAARRIYEQEGFRLVQQEKHHSFGHDLVGQMWDLNLRD